jgi:hypothetical protein
LPSLHPASSEQHPAIPERVQPTAGWQPSLVQIAPSSHTGGAPAVQTPDWHVAVPLQRLPSSQDVPFDAVGCTQPSTGLQASIVHGSASVHALGAPPAQGPLAQCSSLVHGSPLPHWPPGGRHVGCAAALLARARTNAIAPSAKIGFPNDERAAARKAC